MAKKRRNSNLPVNFNPSRNLARNKKLDILVKRNNEIVSQIKEDGLLTEASGPGKIPGRELNVGILENKPEAEKDEKKDEDETNTEEKNAEKKDTCEGESVSHLVADFDYDTVVNQITDEVMKKMEYMLELAFDQEHEYNHQRMKEKLRGIDLQIQENRNMINQSQSFNKGCLELMSSMSRMLNNFPSFDCESTERSGRLKSVLIFILVVIVMAFLFFFGYKMGVGSTGFRAV